MSEREREREEGQGRIWKVDFTALLAGVTLKY